MHELDPLIHAPARLHLLTTLSAVSEAEFATLRAVLEVSDSVLSKHVSALAEVNYVSSRKGVRGGRRTTWICLTATGRGALAAHVGALRELIAGVPADPEPAVRVRSVPPDPRAAPQAAKGQPSTR